MSTPARLVAFAAGLLAVFGAAVGVGSAIGPVGPAPAEPMAEGGHGAEAMAEGPEADSPGGQTVSEDG